MSNLAGKWIVETDWLNDHLDAPDLVILDGSWYLPIMERDAEEEYSNAHIPGAIRFDIDDVADETSDLPHMLPSTVKFASRMKKMGIGDGMRVVVYGGPSSHTAPRVWWTFRAMGFEDVAVLNGGLGKWRAEKRPLDDLPPRQRSPRHFTPRFNGELVCDMDDVKAVLASRSAQIIDARPTARFDGSSDEPRPNLARGHIPGSISLPSSKLFNRDETFKSVDDLRELFALAGVDLAKPIVTTCGSGVTAAILSMALAMLGHPNGAVYDGSWTEWGAAGNWTAGADMPVATGS